jgi:nickel-dependent lactate racemase
MRVELAYGRKGLTIEVPDGAAVIEPQEVPGLPDEQAAVFEALDQPVCSAPLRELASAASRICIVFTDLTRATPNERLIPWLLKYLAGFPPANITLVNALGTHRSNTRAELEQLLTRDVVERFRVVNHQPENRETLRCIGNASDGTPIWLNRDLVEADLRIITGFIEPHFFAGFSGGPKGIMPGVAGLETVMANHCSARMAHANATFGITEGNPVWEQLREIALRAGPAFLVNVALNAQRRITGVFAGDLVAAHREGCAFVKRTAMREFEEPFDIVVTSNSGYPLDLNLYQGVKGMSAGSRVLKAGGDLILACECSDGVPEGSSYERILRSASEPAGVLKYLEQSSAPIPEQWQAQIQASIQQRATVWLHSRLPDDKVKVAHLRPCPDVSAAVRRLAGQVGNACRVAVLPQGPLTIPYVKSA